MAWLKDTYLDFLVLALIIVFGFYSNEILEVVLWVYTALLLIGKALSIFMPSLQKRANKSKAPKYVYHLIYGLSIAVLFYIQHYYLAGVWILIWVLSIISSSKTNKKKEV